MDLIQEVTSFTENAGERTTCSEFNNNPRRLTSYDNHNSHGSLLLNAPNDAATMGATLAGQNDHRTHVHAEESVSNNNDTNAGNMNAATTSATTLQGLNGVTAHNQGEGNLSNNDDTCDRAENTNLQVHHEEEIKALHDNNAWDLVPHSKDMHVIGSKWVFKTKLQSDGAVERLKQNSVARSSTEAEYRSMASATAELIWLTYILRDIEIYILQPPTLYCDNISTFQVSIKPALHSRMKHIDIDYHSVREKVAIGSLVTKYIPSLKQIADIFTKPLPRLQLENLCNKLGIWIASTTSLRGNVNNMAIIKSMESIDDNEVAEITAEHVGLDETAVAEIKEIDTVTSRLKSRR
ncbi:uncharacterized protein LOC116257163 [Nymphaea colorata]|uniref:uncharacterized protein LOC116257163 n=1 Tax=Nymphaea colorata TaxID=210225 RepID=UPI00129D30A6|nr:uncharacterized protein LOC116257163 [Nymphaea colorata]